MDIHVYKCFGMLKRKNFKLAKKAKQQTVMQGKILVSHNSPSRVCGSLLENRYNFGVITSTKDF